MADIVMNRRLKTDQSTRPRTAQSSSRESFQGPRRNGESWTELRSGGDSRNGSPRRAGPLHPAVIAVLVLVLTLVGGELIYRLLILPRLTIEQVQVLSDLGSSDSQILRIAGISAGDSYVDMDTALVQRRLAAYPPVRTARVQKIFPDRVRIHVEARRPLGVILGQNATGAGIGVFDEEGVVYETGSDAGMWNLPVVSGLTVEGLDQGMRLPQTIQAFLQDMKTLQLHNPQLFGLISEYRIEPRTGAQYDVILYPVGYQVPVRISSSIDAELWSYILMVLDVMDREGRLQDMVELDFRGEQVVYRTREG